MKANFAILIFYLLVTAVTFGQTNSYTGKTFFNEKLDQIDFINDSVLVASFRACTEKYQFTDDSLILTIHYCGGGFEPRSAFKLIRRSADRFAFIDNSDNPADTMLFINGQTRIVRLKGFDSIRVDSYGWAGFGRIIIRSDKTVRIADDQWILPNEQPLRYRQVKLTDRQYKKLIDTLSKSLIFMLPKYRGECGEDVTDTDFYIHTNGISITSKGSCLSKIHYKLISYLFHYIARGN